MKKLIIATVAAITTLGISAYTKDNVHPTSRVNAHTSLDAARISATVSEETVPFQTGRANLAQAD